MDFHSTNDFSSIKIGLASPERIREWSYGEVTKPETINYRTLKPEREGLFCEKIFGPTKDWECHCGKYKKVRYKGKICERCGVEITRAKVRRERMGHIELAAPVSHIWYFKGIPSRLGLVLDISPRYLEKVLYFALYIVTDPGDTPLEKMQILNEKEYAEMRERYEDDFEAGMGAEAIKKLLQDIDVPTLRAELTKELETATGQKRAKLLKRLDVVDAFYHSDNKLEWMILDVIPVIPPDIRPMVQLDGGRFATSDLNDLYRRVINRNNRLKRLIELHAPDIIIRNEKRMLQESVDALIDNGRRGRPVTGPSNRPLKSLSDMLKGKQGRFRQNLLGKRVDYSGRSVIVVGPELKMYQCGLPKEMAIELFKPFVMKRLVETGTASNIKSARKMVEKAEKSEVWDALEVVIKDHPVMLNRAPTLHRLGIQAFEPVLVEGRAIKLHPLACTAFNADFDGDQMAVHVPLSAEAQAEARFLMLAAGNLLKPSDGKPVVVPTQDMVLGSYYLTLDKDGELGEGKVFRDVDEALMAYQTGVVTLHSKIKVRRETEFEGEIKRSIIDTTVGKIIFNRAIPQDLGFVDRTREENANLFEVDFLVGKKKLGNIIDACIKVHGTEVTASVLDDIKAQGYKYSTRGAITVAVCDAIIPPEKKEIIAKAEADVNVIREEFNMGLRSDEERYTEVLSIWEKATDEVTDKLQDNLDRYNPIYMMADSGARGSMSQIRQLAGMRGLIANTSGKTIEIPIRANYREGLNILEYFISSRGARKGLADTALRTADSGYLTRRLVDVSQEVIIREDDCHSNEGLEVFDIKSGKQVIEEMHERLLGRYLVHELMGKDEADIIVNSSVQSIEIRSILGCHSKHGVCKKCYGANLANGQPVTVGEAVGIIAAQSIGEPGTQLTMRTFHTGGVASAEDITQGLPRVEELFEVRKPKNLAIISEIDGEVRFDEIKNSRHAVIFNTETAEEKSYLIPFGFRVAVEEGQHIKKGDKITDGAVNPHDILDIMGAQAVQDYLISEVQSTYRLQGVDINDKHIEVIVRQMLKKVRVDDPGSTEFMPGQMYNRNDVLYANKLIKERIANGEEGLTEATWSQQLLGITKASLATDSFLSAASFQETTQENVLIGKLVPAGTGMTKYNSIELEENFIPTGPVAPIEES